MRLYLDVLKWRCGADGPKGNRLGRGKTMMKNKYGFMCCLGQFSTKIEPKTNILNVGTPARCHYLKRNILKADYSNTKLSIDCMNINDSRRTTIKEKIALLRARLKKSGHQLVVKNLKEITNYVN